MSTTDDSDRLSAAREMAVKLLARREHSAAEIRRKLSQRGYDEGTQSAALDWCQDNNLQSDQRYAVAYARQRAERLYGPMMIQAELRQRGVADELIEEALAEVDDDWLEAARRFLQRRRDDLSDYQQRGKTYQALCRKGFSSDIARRALEACQAEAEEQADGE